MADKPNDIETIYNTARRKLSGAERSAYLDNACGNDAALRARVEALLKADDQAGSFLDAPAFDVTVTFDKSPLTEGPGTVIGPYKLLEKIGEGGMAYVYMAEQERPLRRRVALKIIKLGMDTKQVIARFEVERQALAVMDHPNIAKVFDAGATETGRPYFVMELVKGVSITEYCDKNKLSTKERLDLFIQVCNAVQHAHQKGIIHRDIKPSNVMVTLHDGKPVPKVIDFGIAKATIQRLTEKTLFTKYAQMIGTPEYMSPEQAEMSGLDIDTRADIYSLGVLLYELLTGTTPFDAEDLRSKGYGEMQRIIRETEPLKPSTKLSTMGDALTGVAEHRKTNPVLLAKLVRGDLDWIVMKTLEKDRTRRYETVSSLAADVKRHLNEEPVEAGPPSATYRLSKLIRKHRRTVAAVLAIAATLIIGLIISTTLYFIADHARNQEAVARATAEHAEQAEQEQRKLAEDKSESLRRSLYVNSIRLADAKYHEAIAITDPTLLQSCPEDLRGWEWHRLNHIFGQRLMVLPGHRDSVTEIVLSPDGKRVISGSMDETTKVWDLDTGKELMTLGKIENGVLCVAISPDGKRIASAGNSPTIKVWDASSGKELTALKAQADLVGSISFSPDGKFIASSGDDAIEIWDAVTGKKLTGLTGHSGYVNSVTFSPDGKRIVSTSADQTIKVWDAQTSKEIMTLRGHNGYVFCVKLSPDGLRMASGSDDKTIRVWDTATGQELMTLGGHHNSVVSVAFNHDGTRIASGSRDNTIKVWDAATGAELTTLHGHEGVINSVVFCPDNERVVSSSLWNNTVTVWDASVDRERMPLRSPGRTYRLAGFTPDGRRLIAYPPYSSGILILDATTGTEIMRIDSHGEWIWPAAISPDGRRIVSGSWGGTIKVWDLATGAEILAVRGHRNYVLSVAFSPDGNRIVSGSADKTVKVCDAESGTDLMTFRGHESQVTSVGYSPDGRRIASGGADGMVKIWDAATGAEITAIRADEVQVLSVLFSPDGQNIVSAGSDGTLKIWDANAYTRVKTLRGHSGPVHAMAFSPDGSRIVSGGYDQAVRVWDASTGIELLTLRGYQDMIWSVTFSPDGKTLAVAGPGVTLLESAVPLGGYGPRKTIETARRAVEQLYMKHRFYYEVIQWLSRDSVLDESVRKMALQIADSCLWEDADKLNGESWDVVSSPDSDPNAYRQALTKAEKAISLDPNDLNILNTLGVAQYRVGDYEKGLETLTRCEKSRADNHLEPAPENVAFIAMSLHKLGRADEAKAALERLRDLCKEERFAEDQEAQAFLAEAEQLITGEKQ